MKTTLSRKQTESGSAVLMVVIITALAAIVLVAYMGLVSRQNYSTHRSQAWNATVPVIEAGIEDAMSHLNLHGSTNLACDGWQSVGSLFAMQRTLGDSYYIVTISNYIVGATNNAPVIESRGFVSMPVQVASAGNSSMFAAVGVGGGSGYLGRGIRATTGASALFAKGLVAKGKIDLSGNNITTDSFDSTDPTASTNGKYDSSKRKANGDVATNSGLTNSVSVGNADIYGRVSTGPGGSVYLGPNGRIGDLNFGSKGVQTGYVKDDMNIVFQDVKEPYNGGAFNPEPASVGGTNYAYVLGNGNYQVSGALSLSSSDKILVTGSNTVLYVTGNFNMTGQSSIILGAGATLKLYVGGATASLGGNGVINPGSALNFSYYGLTNNTSLSLSGNAAFTGVIYAPNADFTLGGGGNNTYDFVGASITKTATMNGHFNFHYDEALSKFGPMRGYVVTSWNEMSPTEVAAFTLE